ncbi:hypothetical protein N7U66_20525 [Lacinutrix neustonica]|uniref:Outer membrane protein beta-barrel domain-containing protein n=1 Tax=Lacinutrix neustonica TaxID=2980107 RepID=A0A9E8MXK3_9FLAO|nr:hypothetical protein [Lacinutrix neustonica]WAC02129.1 hypothetical protein N7U66_20525 [Lacinutrix neustonica]
MKLNHISLFCVFIITLFSPIKAQDIEVFADFEAGIPLSSSLKNFHEELANQVDFENFETKDNFNYNYGFTFGLRINRKASIFFSNKVSGAKSSVADYSGFVRITNEIIGYTFGLEYEIPLMESEKKNLNLGLKGLVTSSNLNLTSASRILSAPQSESLEFKSLDFGGAVGINYEYSIGFITLRAHLDLNVYIGGKLTLKDDDSGGFLIDQSGNKVTTSWTGLTGGIGLIVPLYK